MMNIERLMNVSDSIDIVWSMVSIVSAFVLGIFISAIYMNICKKEGYSRNFIIGLVILPAVVAAVILLIGSNVARAFSMAGAFALVRFRSTPGNARDISVVFFSMAAGLACGLGYVLFAVCFVVVILAALVILTFMGYGVKADNRKQLRVTIPENLNFSTVFDEVFGKYLNEYKLTKVKTTNMGTMYELTYEVVVKENTQEKEFIDDLRVRNGNLNIVLGLMPTGSSEQLN